LLIAPFLSCSSLHLLPFVFIQLSSFAGPEFTKITIWLCLIRHFSSFQPQPQRELLPFGQPQLSKPLLSNASLHLSSFVAAFESEPWPLLVALSVN
jgi:hypothetical protein